MRCYLISDNIDTLVGMRLAGVPGEVVHHPQEVLDALKRAFQNDEIATVFITEKLALLCEDTVRHLKETVAMPLLVTIPDRHGNTDVTDSLSRYLRETVGIHI